MTHNQISWMLGRQQAAASTKQAEAAERNAATNARHEEGLWYHDRYGNPTSSITEREYRFNRGMEEYKMAWDVIDRITGGIFSIAGLFA